MSLYEHPLQRGPWSGDRSVAREHGPPPRRGRSVAGSVAVRPVADAVAPATLNCPTARDVKNAEYLVNGYQVHGVGVVLSGRPDLIAEPYPSIGAPHVEAAMLTQLARLPDPLR